MLKTSPQCVVNDGQVAKQKKSTDQILFVCNVGLVLKKEAYCITFSMQNSLLWQYNCETNEGTEYKQSIFGYFLNPFFVFSAYSVENEH